MSPAVIFRWIYEKGPGGAFANTLRRPVFNRSAEALLKDCLHTLSCSAFSKLTHAATHAWKLCGMVFQDTAGGLVSCVLEFELFDGVHNAWRNGFR
ncbi:hypothetical protein WL80_02430 [Burkholderia ubonensis]|nr:hypothetical protein WL80_02430 [Burkholderia ubonensis]